MYRWLAWNVLFRAHESAKGHATFKILRDMEAADRLSPAQMESLQAQKLQEFLDYGYRNVPYVQNIMREAGVTPASIQDPRDLIRLPRMTKADVRTNLPLLRSKIGGKLNTFSTGGSTGEPLIFELSSRRTASRVACRQRVSRWWGVSVGDSELALWGSPIEVGNQDRIRRLRDSLLRTRLLSAFEMNDATMSRYLDEIERGHFRHIFAYPSAIYLLCLQARKQQRNLRNLGIKVVFVTGEVLFPHQRELISETLNCPVANGYGGRDSGFISHECPQGGMHVLSDAVVTELLDAEGRPVPPGVPGEIVVTDLYSHEFPFLRYATGDVGMWSTRTCGCGLPLALLESIEGRSNDSIVAPDGRIVNSLAVIYPVREVAGIEHFRIRQKETTVFTVQIVRNDLFRREGESYIQKAWESLLRAPLEVSFEYLPQLPAERSGKFRHVVSEVPAGQSLRPGIELQNRGQGPLPVAESESGKEFLCK